MLPRQTPLLTDAVASANWSGYVARRASGGGFESAAGTWRMPRVRCDRGSDSSATFWVGIGGFDVESPSLQQAGASADCSPTGAASYRLWTGVIPAPPTFVSLRVAAGDVISASIAVAKHAVSFTLRNVTRGTRYVARARRPGTADVSTAEWIAEAPSLCRTISVCQILPLPDFGSVAFTDVRASPGGAAGPLRVTPVSLVRDAGSRSVPGPMSPAGRSFTVTFRGRGPHGSAGGASAPGPR